MTLSIEVLPAPFGPMMARISPFLTSNDTSRIACTPPNDNDTFSIESRISSAATSLTDGALMSTRRSFVLGMRGKTSCRLPHRGRGRDSGHVADFHPRRKHALAAVLEGHLGRDVGLLRAVIERVDQRCIALGDKAAAHLLGPRHLAIVGV